MRRHTPGELRKGRRTVHGWAVSRMQLGFLRCGQHMSRTGRWGVKLFQPPVLPLRFTCKTPCSNHDSSATFDCFCGEWAGAAVALKTILSPWLSVGHGLGVDSAF
ncbi:hypothetical protein INR49_009345 [Caranx melampygus]|nr:hypothetical protein INR49_009345 [Caranx melampygus]